MTKLYNRASEKAKRQQLRRNMTMLNFCSGSLLCLRIKSVIAILVFSFVKTSNKSCIQFELEPVI